MYEASDYLEFHQRVGIHNMPVIAFNVDDHPDVFDGVRLVIQEEITRSGHSPEKLMEYTDASLTSWSKRRNLWKVIRLFYDGVTRNAIRHVIEPEYQTDFIAIYENCVHKEKRVPAGFWNIIPFDAVVEILQNVFFRDEEMSPLEVYQMKYQSEINDVITKYHLRGLIAARFQNTVATMVQAILPFHAWTDEMVLSHYERNCWPKGFWTSKNKAAAKYGAILFRHWLMNHLHHLYQDGETWVIAVDAAQLAIDKLTGAQLAYGNITHELAQAAFPNKIIRLIQSNYAPLFTMTEQTLCDIWDGVHAGTVNKLPVGLVSDKNPRRHILIPALCFHIGQTLREWDQMEMLGHTDAQIRDVLREAGLNWVVSEIPADMLREWMEKYSAQWIDDEVERMKDQILRSWLLIQSGERSRFPYRILTRQPEHAQELAAYLVREAIWRDLGMTSAKIARMSERAWVDFLKRECLGLIRPVLSKQDVEELIRTEETLSAQTSDAKVS